MRFKNITRKMNGGRIKQRDILKHCIGWDFGMWPLTVLTGFSYKNMAVIMNVLSNKSCF